MPKNKPKAPVSPVVIGEENDPFGEETVFERGALDAAEQRFIGRALRFLVGVQTMSHLRRARREGYTRQEHALGWKLLRAAGGEDRPLEHWFEEIGVGASTGQEQMAVLQPIDLFENTWFPRTRAIIRRVVAGQHREEFAAAFFKDLEQQPLGPGVVRSVATYIGRVEGLATSARPGAKAVFATLQERGLTDKHLARIKGLLADVEAPGEVPATNLTAEEIAAAQTKQREAHAALRDWFNDWATTLRPAFGARAQVTLGLTVVSRTGKVEDDGESSPTPAPAV